MNEKSGNTKVYAQYETTILKLFGLAFDNNCRWDRDLAYQEMMVNGISITGHVDSASQMIDRINEKANQSGVKARLQTGKTIDIELYAQDGRNIEIKLGDQNLTECLSPQFKVGKSYVFGGALTLRSNEPIHINQQNFAYLNLPAQLEIPRQNSWSIDSVDLTTQENAQAALSILDSALSDINSRIVEIQ